MLCRCHTVLEFRSMHCRTQRRTCPTILRSSGQAPSQRVTSDIPVGGANRRVACRRYFCAAISEVPPPSGWCFQRYIDGYASTRMGLIGFIPLLTFISLEVSILFLAPTVHDCAERAERQVPPRPGVTYQSHTARG